MKSVIFQALYLFLSFAAPLWAQESFYFHPHIGVGFNSQQGTSYLFGVDLGYRANENWRMGLAAHYAAGGSPSRDREYGGGAFLGYAQTVSENITGHVRQEILYMDVRNPIDPLPASGPGYESESGVASTTSIGLTARLSDNLAISGGYRFVVGLTNPDLGEGRSGPMFGLMVGL